METLSVPPNAPNGLASFDSSEVKAPTGLLTSVPAWGNFLYQNFVLPALSPSADWLNSTPFAPSQPQNQAQSTVPDYFSDSWSSSNNGNTTAGGSLAQLQTFALGDPTTGGPSTQSFYNPNELYINPAVALPQLQVLQQQSLQHNQPQQQQSISPSLLVATSSRTISPSLDVVEATIASPSPLTSSPASGVTTSLPAAVSSHHMTRGLSIDSEIEHETHDGDHLSPSEHEHDHDEGVERDGMIWGMKVEDYRALSARERKRVRNRISARTFRAKRKEHLSGLEQTIQSKDLQIKLANEETARLKREVAELKRKLAKYEKFSNSPVA